MAKIRINGEEYDLRMDIHAMEQIEKEFGDIRDALRMFRAGERKVSMIKAMFRILAISGRKRAGRADGHELLSDAAGPSTGHHFRRRPETILRGTGCF